MQSCQSLRDDFSFLPFNSNSDQINFEPHSDIREVYDGGTYYPSTWEQEVDAIKEVVVDSDSTILPQPVPACQEWKAKPSSIFHYLKELYHEEIRENRNLAVPETRQTSYLLDKLIRRNDRFNMVIISLFPMLKGYYTYSFSIDHKIQGECKQPYTKDVLLDYIDREQLPTPYLEYWEQNFPQLFYDGCVIAQVRDLRLGSPPQVCHVLLKPHTQSLISDVNKLLMEHSDSWTPEEQFSVECNVINNAQRSLCLDPSPEIGKRMLKLHQDLHAFDTNSIRNLLFRNSQLVQHRKRKFEHLLPKPNKFLSDFITEKKAATLSVLDSSVVPKSDLNLTCPQECPPAREIHNKVFKLSKMFKMA